MVSFVDGTRRHDEDDDDDGADVVNNADVG
jgi:hypothetical protein